jgi:hypothetical protein
VGFSSHHGGESLAWDEIDPTRGRVDDHVVVFVARGSHANYFSPGKHHVPECHKVLCGDRSDGCGDPLPPSSYVLRPFEPYVFSGDYGSGNFLRGGLKRWGTGINVDDPQRRENTFVVPLRWLRGTQKVAKPTYKSRCKVASPNERRSS